MDVSRVIAALRNESEIDNLSVAERMAFAHMQVVQARVRTPEVVLPKRFLVPHAIEQMYRFPRTRQ
jgi:hypothetical protein